MKCNYYKFDVFQPYIFGGEIHKRLVDAKRAFLQHIAQGHSIGNCIYGYATKDENVALTYTPYYSDIGSLGRTKLTLIGKAFRKQKKDYANKKASKNDEN
jgi:hypothetical protein